jgi:hypothetical protein
LHVDGLEAPLRWVREGRAERIDGGLVLTAGPRTDLFVDPRSDEVVATAPALVGPVTPPFTVRARVAADLRETFDAAALLVLGPDDRTWAKLAVERAPDGATTIVTVVTRGVSDDCNHMTIEPIGCWLRVTGLGDDVFALHTSGDGRTWDLVRYARLAGASAVGLSVQSPLGSGCTARFDHVRWDRTTIADIRDGT